MSVSKYATELDLTRAGIVILPVYATIGDLTSTSYTTAGSMAYAGGSYYGRTASAYRQFMFQDGAGGLNYFPVSDSSGIFQPMTLTAVQSLIGSGSLPGGSNNQTLRHNSSTWVASSFLVNTSSAIGIGLTSPTAVLELNSGGIRLPANSSAVTTTQTIYFTNKDILRFGTAQAIEKCLVKEFNISQNTYWNAGDYWDIATISYNEFSHLVMDIEGGGSSFGYYSKTDLPLAYANDVYYPLGYTPTNNVWFYAALKEIWSRSWGNRFADNFRIAFQVNGGTVNIRLVVKTSGEIRDYPADYGNAAMVFRLYFSTNASQYANPQILTSTGTGMTLPSTTLPQVYSAPQGYAIFRNAVSIGEAYKAYIPPSDGLLVAGNVGIGASSPSAKLHVNGSIRFQTFTTNGNILTHDGSGNLASTAPGSLGVPTIYTANGSLTAARTVTMGSYSLTFDASAASSSPNTMLILKGKETSFSTRFFDIQNESAVTSFRGSATSSLVTLEALNSHNLRVQGVTFVTIATGSDKNATVHTDGWFGVYNSLTADPATTPSTAGIWYRSDLGAFKFRQASASLQFASVEDDMIGTGTQVVTATTHTLSGLNYLTRFHAASNAITVTLGTGLKEGRDYLVRCTSNAINTVTFNADTGAGMVMYVDTKSTITLTTLVVGAGGSGIEAPDRIFIIRRVGTVIWIK